MGLVVALIVGIVLIVLAGLSGEELFLWGGIVILVATAVKALS
jgi:hypothetical protein